jgi:pyrroline-5-carboxylate reductase
MNKILLVGTGKMGGALLKKWEENLSQVISTLDPHNPNADYQSATDITTPFDTIVLAVKPQIMGDVVEGLKPIITPAT